MTMNEHIRRLRGHIAKAWKAWQQIDAFRGLLEVLRFAGWPLYILSASGILGVGVSASLYALDLLAGYWYLLVTSLALVIALAPWVVVLKSKTSAHSQEQIHGEFLDLIREQSNFGEDMLGVTDPDVEYRWARSTGQLIREYVGRDEEARFYSDEDLLGNRMDYLGRRLYRLQELLDRIDTAPPKIRDIT